MAPTAAPALAHQHLISPDVLGLDGICACLCLSPLHCLKPCYRTSHSSRCPGSRGVPQSLMPSSDSTSSVLDGQLGSASSLSVTLTSGAPPEFSSNLLSLLHRSWNSPAWQGALLSPKCCVAAYDS